MAVNDDGNVDESVSIRSMNPNDQIAENTSMKPLGKRWSQMILTLLLIGIGVIGFWRLKAGRTSAEKMRPESPRPIARVITVASASESVALTGYGTVQPVREIAIMPQVSGKVVDIAPFLVDGGVFQKGQLLMQIDDADYVIAVTLAAARLKDAESKYELAKEEAAAARDEWREIHGQRPPPPLVAKEPQLAASRAQLDAARADLKKAQLELARTQIVAPFDGRVSEKSVDVGQYVTPGQRLATLFATDAAEIIVPMEDQDLFWFHVPGFTAGNGTGALAEVSAQVAGQMKTWTGRVVRAEGKLDERTRMVNVVVRVDQPYGSRPPLAIGLFAKVQIKGRSLDNAVRIPRSALRDSNQVWVVNDQDRLIFRIVDIARRSINGVIIQKGLKEGERVVVSALKGVSDGMYVRPITSVPKDVESTIQPGQK